jgi:hypothetical protein
MYVYGGFGSADIITGRLDYTVNHVRLVIKCFRPLKHLTSWTSTVDHQRQLWLINQSHRLPSATPCLAQLGSVQRNYRLKQLIISYTGVDVMQCHARHCGINFIPVHSHLGPIGGQPHKSHSHRLNMVERLHICFIWFMSCSMYTISCNYLLKLR